MKRRNVRSTIGLICSLMMMASGLARPVWAQDATADPILKLYVDPATHVVYTEPGRGRRLLATIPSSALSPSTNSLEQRQERTEQELQENRAQLTELAQKNQQLESQNENFQTQIAEIKPAWRSYVDNFQDKFRLGTLVYGDYRYYSHTGFQPQEMTQLTNPGPGNNGWSSFDITRAYINLFFFPTKDWTMRITPNIYKTIGANSTTNGEKIGQSTAFGTNLDGNLSYRLKYALLQYNDLWKSVPMLKDGTVSMGEVPNPLVGWEEDLYGYRFVNLTPWNYLSLSSTQLGMSMEGPVTIGKLKYADYGFGVYNNASFHAFENTNTKEAMARITVYPFGSTWRFQGLGLTGFYNYGYGNTAPDTADLPATLKGPDAHITRIAALIHYAAEQWGLASEFDYGNNAFSASNLWSGSAPADAFGFVTGPSLSKAAWNPHCSAQTKCYDIFNSYGPSTNASEAILNNGQSRQIGFDLFGHYHIPETPITAFGMFQWFMPNDKFADDPLDFQRFVVGASYQVNEFLRFAVDSQNTLFYHNQEAIPVSYLSKFGYVPGGTFNGLLLPSQGSIPYMVPQDTHAIFANMEFNY